MGVDDIKYGNPTLGQLKVIREDVGGVLSSAIFLGIVEDIVTNCPPPLNSSSETIGELKYLASLGLNATQEDKEFCQTMEERHYEWLYNWGREMGISVTLDNIMEWVKRIDPLTFYLKDFFNRPRPYQLGRVYEIPLYPIIVTDADSAAYPSGHTMDFLVILYNFIRLRPELKKECVELYSRIKTVRELSGLHYPSDRKVSERIFYRLLLNGLI
jgi:hypothetical protein